MSDLMDRKAQLYSELRARLDERFAADQAAGVDAGVYADTTAIVDAMVSALPTGNIYDESVGPFYDTATLIRWLGISKQAVLKRAASGTLIACQLADHRRTRAYPTWQFNADRTVIEHLPEVWKILRDGANDPWTAALWLCSPNRDLDGKTAVEHLRAGGDPAPVLASARDDAARWAA